MSPRPDATRARLPSPGEILELTLEKATAGGRMLARHNGLVVLVHGAIPGERITARVERTSTGVAYAQTVEVLAPSVDRRPAQDPRCGGQALAHVAYHRQLQLKSEVIRDALARIGKIERSATPVVTPSPERGYRMRARLHARNGRLGFFREGSHEICDALGTGQLSVSCGRWIASAQAQIDSLRLGDLIGVELAENIDGTQLACHLEVEGRSPVEAFTVLAREATGLSASHTGRPRTYVLAGSPLVVDRLHAGGPDAATFVIERDVRAFFQGNRFLLQPLLTHVLSFVDEGPVTDLYAGVGVFGLAAAAAGAGPVDLIEGDRVSGASLARNAEPFGGRVHVQSMPVETFLASAPPGRSRTVIVDPPRTGLSRAALSGVLRVRAARVVYVSCDVATLARDVRGLVDAGYDLRDVSAFDLFPNTAHIETVAVLERP